MDTLIREQIKSLEEELKSLSPMTKEQEVLLNKKLELEFNYNSNHIEGNTLTYAETKQFLQFDETGGNHTGREYDEMRASEVALELIKELAADKERPLNETFIKYLNQVLLVRPYWKDALTLDGQQTRRKISIGEYKSQPNSVLLENGKMFDYASPAETPMLMHDLLDWYKAEIEKGELHSVELAALLHYKFVCIHPFDDGNGRISRLLMNYFLYKNNFPPIIIKTDDKSNYRRALHDADSGNLESFVNYIAEQFIWSLELSIKASKNESLEEQEDWKKKLDVLKKDLQRKDTLEIRKSDGLIVEIITKKIISTINSVFGILIDFQDLYLRCAILIKKEINNYVMLPLEKFSIETVEEFYSDHFYISFYYSEFRKNGSQPFNTEIELQFEFAYYYYDIFIDNKKYLTKLYHQNFTSQDVNLISNECGKILLTKIEKQLNPPS